MERNCWLYAGAWNFENAVGGIRVFSWDPASRQLSPAGVYGEEYPCQSILTLKDGLLFSICEQRDCAKVVSYRMDFSSGALVLLDCLDLDSHTLSYLSCDPSGPWLYVSSMGRGEIILIRYDEDGHLIESDKMRFTGHSVTPRQNCAKVHCVASSPDGSLVLASNLGADEVAVIRLDRKAGKMVLTGCVNTDPGQGPRHIAFHPSSRFAYVVTEMGNRVYAYEFIDGRPVETAALPTRSFRGKQTGSAADILVGSDGSVLLATNRGQNNIAQWQVREDSGLPVLQRFITCAGSGPRGICFDPEQTVLFSANCDSSTIDVIDLDSGVTLQSVECPNASCERMTAI